MVLIHRSRFCPLHNSQPGGSPIRRCWHRSMSHFDKQWSPCRRTFGGSLTLAEWATLPSSRRVMIFDDVNGSRQLIWRPWALWNGEAGVLLLRGRDPGGRLITSSSTWSDRRGNTQLTSQPNFPGSRRRPQSHAEAARYIFRLICSYVHEYIPTYSLYSR